MITMFRIMLIGPYYESDYMFDMTLCAIYVKICGFEFLSVHRRNICLIVCFGIKLKALLATEPEIDYAIVISVIFRAYGEI